MTPGGRVKGAWGPPPKQCKASVIQRYVAQSTAVEVAGQRKWTINLNERKNAIVRFFEPTPSAVDVVSKLVAGGGIEPPTLGL